jgi:hypothetical protein
LIVGVDEMIQNVGLRASGEPYAVRELAMFEARVAFLDVT